MYRDQGPLGALCRTVLTLRAWNPPDGHAGSSRTSSSQERTRQPARGSDGNADWSMSKTGAPRLPSPRAGGPSSSRPRVRRSWSPCGVLFHDLPHRVPRSLSCKCAGPHDLRTYASPRCDRWRPKPDLTWLRLAFAPSAGGSRSGRGPPSAPPPRACRVPRTGASRASAPPARSGRPPLDTTAATVSSRAAGVPAMSNRCSRLRTSTRSSWGVSRSISRDPNPASRRVAAMRVSAAVPARPAAMREGHHAVSVLRDRREPASGYLAPNPWIDVQLRSGGTVSDAA
jgi:hypothetical protein